MRRLGSLLLALLALSACARDSIPEARSSGQVPVVIISVDTLRSDRLPAYGYEDVATPAIDALRSDGVLFENAFSHYPLTLPSHVSLMTGLLPTESGVRDNIGYRMASGQPHMARWLSDRGYATGGAVSAWILRSETGLGEGFDFYEDSLDLIGGAGLGESQRPGSETVKRALEWLGEVPKEDPFLLFVHLYEPHTPYDAPEPFASRYGGQPYDAEIAYSDALVGEILDALRERGQYDEALIVFLSDHGEGLGDHGEIEHGILLYREAIQIPLIVKLPGGRGADSSVAVAAGIRDILPTIQALIEEAPEGRVTLLDLMAEDAPQRAIYSETYYPRLHLGWSDLASLASGSYHYIEGPDPELYDLVADFEETKNVLREERRVYSELRDELAGLRTELAAPSEVDDEAAEKLAALGYLSSAPSTVEGDLPDPKEKLPSLQDLLEAIRHFSLEEYDAAIEGFERVLAENPGMVDAWENLAQSLHRSGRYQEAEEAYGKALELSGGADRIAMSMARLFLEQQRWQEAWQHAELALPSNPGAAHQLLGEIAFAEEKLELAEQHAKASLEERQEGIPSLLILAQVAASADRVDEARQLVARAEAEQAKRHGDETTPGLYFVKGDIEARLGNGQAAMSSFQEEIRRHPLDTRAYCRLAVVHTVEGRGAEAVAVLREMVESNPRPAAYGAAVETFQTLGDARAAQALLGHALGLYPGDPLLLELARGF